MALNIVDIPAGGGGWFKADPEMTEWTAFLIEVKHFERQRPGAYGPKDSALVDMTIFKSEESLASGIPDEVREGTRVEQTVLARDLGVIGVGGATIVTLAQVASKKPGSHPAWVWRQAGADAKRAVLAYAEKREAELDAILAGAPQF